MLGHAYLTVLILNDFIISFKSSSKHSSTAPLVQPWLKETADINGIGNSPFHGLRTTTQQYWLKNFQCCLFLSRQVITTNATVTKNRNLGKVKAQGREKREKSKIMRMFLFFIYIGVYGVYVELWSSAVFNELILNMQWLLSFYNSAHAVSS